MSNNEREFLAVTATWPEVISQRPLSSEEQQKARWETVVEHIARCARAEIILPDAVGDVDFGPKPTPEHPVEVRHLMRLVREFNLRFIKVIPNQDHNGQGGEGLISIGKVVEIDDEETVHIVDTDQKFKGVLRKDGTTKGLPEEIVTSLTPNYLQITESDVSDSRGNGRRRFKTLYRKPKDYDVGYTAQS